MCEQHGSLISSNTGNLEEDDVGSISRWKRTKAGMLELGAYGANFREDVFGRPVRPYGAVSLSRSSMGLSGKQQKWT